MRRRIYTQVVLLLTVAVFATAGSVAHAQFEKSSSELDVNLRGGITPPPATTPPATTPPATTPPATTPPATTPPATTPPATTPPQSQVDNFFSVGGLLTRAEGLLNLIIPFLIGLAVFMILWGIFLYVTKAAEEEKRAEARLYIVWGIVAVFSMLSLWGFVNILVNSFSLQTTFDASVVPRAPQLSE